jgi:hypothetical protein
MRVQTFMGRIGVETLSQLDDQINKWLERTKIEPKFVTQSCGIEEYHESGSKEAVVITQIWY